MQEHLNLICAYAIGFLLTYKYVMSFCLSEPERYPFAWYRQVFAIATGSIWLLFWIVVILIPLEDETN